MSTEAGCLEVKLLRGALAEQNPVTSHSGSSALTPASLVTVVDKGRLPDKELFPKLFNVAPFRRLPYRESS